MICGPDGLQPFSLFLIFLICLGIQNSILHFGKSFAFAQFYDWKLSIFQMSSKQFFQTYVSGSRTFLYKKDEVDLICTDFSKAFDRIVHNILFDKLTVFVRIALLSFLNLTLPIECNVQHITDLCQKSILHHLEFQKDLILVDYYFLSL